MIVGISMRAMNYGVWLQMAHLKKKCFSKSHYKRKSLKWVQDKISRIFGSHCDFKSIRLPLLGPAISPIILIIKRALTVCIFQFIINKLAKLKPKEINTIKLELKTGELSQDIKLWILNIGTWARYMISSFKPSNDLLKLLIGLRLMSAKPNVIDCYIEKPFI